MTPAVSVLLPTHNKAHLLSLAIKSVLTQTLQDFEVLIVGDGCTDDTAEIVRSFDDRRLIWYDLPKAPNFGYANRNVALREAKGRLVAFMAHDDLWLSDHLERLVPVFDDPNVEIAYSRPLLVIPGGIIVPGLLNLDSAPGRTFFLEVGNQIPAGCFVHRRACFAKYGYWDDRLPGAADWDMWVRIIKGGGDGNCLYVSTPTCLHFKADWHGRQYDQRLMFPAWLHLFDSGHLPDALRVSAGEGVTEQEAIWNTMCPSPAEWNIGVRSAIQQALDLLAYQGLTSIAENRSLRTVLDDAAPIKKTRAWKLVREFKKTGWGRRIYRGLKVFES